MASMATVDRYPGVPRYLGTRDVARALGVDGRTVSAWLTRYPPGSDHPVPAPEVIIGDVLGWAEDRLPEWETWRAGMPGRGAGGGRPRKTAEEKLVGGIVDAMDTFECARDAERRRETAGPADTMGPVPKLSPRAWDVLDDSGGVRVGGKSRTVEALQRAGLVKPAPGRGVTDAGLAHLARRTGAEAQAETGLAPGMLVEWAEGDGTTHRGTLRSLHMWVVTPMTAHIRDRRARYPMCVIDTDTAPRIIDAHAVTVQPG